MPLPVLALMALTSLPRATEYRFDFTSVRGAAPWFLQLQEVRLYAPCKDTPLHIHKATNPGGRSPNSQPVTDLVDGNLEDASSKWVDLSFNNPNPISTLILQLDEPASVDRYELFTANDVPKRDPTEWQMYRKPIGSGDWQLVASQAFDPPVARHTSYGVFSLDGLESSHCDPSHHIASSPPPPLPRSVTTGSASRHIEPPRVHHADAISVSDLESVPKQASTGEVSFNSLSLCGIVMLALAGASHVVGMSTLSKALLLAFLHNMLQIFAVGAALHSIIVFDVGTILMIPYLVAMAAVATREVEARCTVAYGGMLPHLFASVCSGVLVTLLLVSVTIPWCEARCMVPICGAALFASVYVVPVGIKSYLTSLQTEDNIAHVLMACGASRWEAGLPAIQLALTEAMNSQLNGQGSMLMLMFIPSIMAGAILGGASPLLAAQYQVVVVCSAVSASSTVLTLTLVAATSSWGIFDEEHRLCVDRIVTFKEPKTSKATLNGTRDETLMDSDRFFRQIIRQVLRGIRNSGTDEEADSTTCALDQVEDAPIPGLDRHGASESFPSFTLLNEQAVADDVVLMGRGCRILRKGSDRVLLRDASVGVHAESSLVLRGPPGCGKTCLLRALARLDALSAGQLRLSGMSASSIKARRWRSEVCYVQQHSSRGLLGSPQGLLDQILELKTQHRRALTANHHLAKVPISQRTAGAEHNDDHPLGTLQETRERLVFMAESIGMKAELLSQPWSALSASDGQQMFLCVMLALRPRVLLLDDCLNAMAADAKRRIETCVLKSATAVVWVTSDDEQAERVATEGQSFFMDDS